MLSGSAVAPSISLLRRGIAVVAAAVAVLLGWDAAAAAPAPVIDGKIADGEYASHFLARNIGMELHWTIEGDSIYLGLSAPTTGWLAIGWELFLQDYYANRSVTHANDVSLGGRDDVLEASGTEDQSSTTIEFRRGLDTGDRFDRPITPGTHTVQLAYAPTDDFVTYHGEKRTVVRIDFFAGGAQEAGLFARPRALGTGNGRLKPWGLTVAAGVVVIIGVTTAYLLWPQRDRLPPQR